MTLFQMTANNFTIDPPGLAIDEWHKAMINIHACFTIITRDQKTFFEEEVCIVELWNALQFWINAKPKLPIFIYESMDFEEENILRFQCLDSKTWGIYSPWQQTQDPINIPLEDLTAEVSKFLQETQDNIKRELDVELRTLKPI